MSQPSSLSNNTALVSQRMWNETGNHGGKSSWNGRGRRNGGDISRNGCRGQDNNSRLTSYHCGEIGHTKHTCWKLHEKLLLQQVTNFATHETSPLSTDKTVLISADKYARFIHYQASKTVYQCSNNHG